MYSCVNSMYSCDHSCDTLLIQISLRAGGLGARWLLEAETDTGGHTRRKCTELYNDIG